MSREERWTDIRFRLESVVVVPSSRLPFSVLLLAQVPTHEHILLLNVDLQPPGLSISVS